MKAEQRLLNEAWEHIIAQGGPSVEEGRCRYQGPDGVGCAFAPAITDYDPRMETLGAGNLLEDFSDNLHPWARDLDEYFAAEVQRCHDKAVQDHPRELFMDEFKTNMAAVAKRYELVCPS